MKKKICYRFINLGYDLFTTQDNIDNSPKKLMRILKINLTRSRQSLVKDKLNELSGNRKCNFCNRIIAFDKFEYDIEASDNGYNIIFKSHISDKPYGKYNVCAIKDCKSRILNPNSVEFISIAYEVSVEESLNIIHSRNKSPFYKENHQSLDSYSKFQGHADIHQEIKFEWTKKQINTVELHKNNYIAQHGLGSWKTLNSELKDNSSLKYFIRKYGDNETAIEKFKEKGIKCSIKRPSIDSDIDVLKSWLKTQNIIVETITVFKLECNKRLSRMGLIGRCLFLNRIFNNPNDKSYSLFVFGAKIFEVTDIFEFLQIPKQIINIRNQFSTNMYSYHSTIDGMFFRSDKELSLYLRLKELKNIKILDTNKKYKIGINDELFYYDLLIEYNGLKYYIEICGNCDLDYIEKMKYKQHNNNSILIESKYVDKFINDCINEKDIRNEKYYKFC